MSRCDKAAEGWYCTREAGHDGPCAAKEGFAPIAQTDAFTDDLWKLVHRYADEWDLTVLQVVGCFELVKSELLAKLPLR